MSWKDSLNEYLDKSESDAEYIDDIVFAITTDICKKLDGYVSYVSQILKDTSHAITDEELDDIIMTIPTLVYFVSEAQERMGIRQDVSETNYKNLYNKYYTQAEGTAQIRKSYCEGLLENEALVSIVYKKAYDIIKQKVSIAIELLQSSKKVLSRRMSAAELERSAPNKDRSVF